MIDHPSHKTAENSSAEIEVGLRVRELRGQKGYSLRTLADRSGLNINTLSLIENGKSSSSIGTLQQLARALDVPITAFFASEPVSKQIVFTRHDQRPEATLNNARMQNLGKDLAGNAVQPFVMTLEPGAGSGERMIAHSGHEFVYCLVGQVRCAIESSDYRLDAGDSIVFAAHLPHRWENCGEQPAQILLIFYPANQPDELGRKHFGE